MLKGFLRGLVCMSAVAVFAVLFMSVGVSESIVNPEIIRYGPVTPDFSTQAVRMSYYNGGRRMGVGGGGEHQFVWFSLLDLAGNAVSKASAPQVVEPGETYSAGVHPTIVLPQGTPVVPVIEVFRADEPEFVRRAQRPDRVRRHSVQLMTSGITDVLRVTADASGGVGGIDDPEMCPAAGVHPEIVLSPVAVNPLTQRLRVSILRIDEPTLEPVGFTVGVFDVDGNDGGIKIPWEVPAGEIGVSGIVNINPASTSPVVVPYVEIAGAVGPQIIRVTAEVMNMSTRKTTVVQSQVGRIVPNRFQYLPVP